jgi:threonine synthase
MDKLVVATNANDILARFWKTGRYEKADSGEPEQHTDDEDESAASHGRYPSLTEDEAFRRQQEAVAESVAANGASDGKQFGAAAATNGSSSSNADAKGVVAETLSPAMDILVSSNFERLLFYLALEGTTAGAVAADGEVDGGQAARVRMAAANVNSWMDKLKTEHKVKVPRASLEAARRDMHADRASDEQVRRDFSLRIPSAARTIRERVLTLLPSLQTTETIKKYFTKQDKYGSYVADPHTAVGLSVANRIAASKCVPVPPFPLFSPFATLFHPFLRLLNPITDLSSLHSAPNVVQIVLSTAHPAKFDAAVSDALASEPSFNFKRDVLPKEFEGLLDRERRVIECKATPEAIKEIVAREVKKLGFETKSEGPLAI